jgi:hypothetical protein
MKHQAECKQYLLFNNRLLLATRMFPCWLDNYCKVWCSPVGRGGAQAPAGPGSGKPCTLTRSASPVHPRIQGGSHTGMSGCCPGERATQQASAAAATVRNETRQGMVRLNVWDQVMWLLVQACEYDSCHNKEYSECT